MHFSRFVTVLAFTMTAASAYAGETCGAYLDMRSTKLVFSNRETAFKVDGSCVGVFIHNLSGVELLGQKVPVALELSIESWQDVNNVMSELVRLSPQPLHIDTEAGPQSTVLRASLL